MQISTDDHPLPLSTCWLFWIAVPTGDQEGVMATLGLTRSRSVTFAEAAAVIEDDGHGGTDGHARVYVSPELDGWTLVIGPWCDPCDDETSDEMLRLCADLSSRYGQAQAYYYGEQGDGSAWLIAEDGAVVRRYCETGVPDEDALFTLGQPLPLERSRREELGLSPTWDESARGSEAEDERKWGGHDMAPEIAAALGISPRGLTPQTPVRGTGLLAHTGVSTEEGSWM